MQCVGRGTVRWSRKTSQVVTQRLGHLLVGIEPKNTTNGNSLAVQWLGLPAFTAEGLGSVPSQGTKILQATWHSQKQKQKQNKRHNLAKEWEEEGFTTCSK